MSPRITTHIYPLPKEVASEAFFGDGPNGEKDFYRYSLRRTWDSSRASVLFIMMNPSAADYNVDDATVRKCRQYAERWRYGDLWVCNLFAARCTDPKALVQIEHPCGRDNLYHIEKVVSLCDLIVCAWGNPPTRKLQDWRGIMESWLRAKCEYLYALKLNQDGQPAHPLYLKSDIKPFVWAPGYVDGKSKVDFNQGGTE